jgi:hypothetical protein
MGLIRLLHRVYLRHELRWIENAMADETDRHARHDAMMKFLRIKASDLRWQIGGTGKRASLLLSGLKARK